jgi:hypothetical protein
MRGVYQLVNRHEFYADKRTLGVIHRHFSNYWWPLQAANDPPVEHWRWR